MIEYTFTLSDHKSNIGLSIALLYPLNIRIGAACAALSLLTLISGLIANVEFLLVLSFIFMLPAFYAFYRWVKTVRSRTVTMRWVFKKHSVFKLNFVFTKQGDTFRDVCKETGNVTEFKKSDIKKIIFTKNTIYVKDLNSSVYSFPNKPEIAELLRG